MEKTPYKWSGRANKLKSVSTRQKCSLGYRRFKIKSVCWAETPDITGKKGTVSCQQFAQLRSMIRKPVIPWWIVSIPRKSSVFFSVILSNSIEILMRPWWSWDTWQRALTGGVPNKGYARCFCCPMPTGLIVSFWIDVHGWNISMRCHFVMNQMKWFLLRRTIISLTPLVKFRKHHIEMRSCKVKSGDYICGFRKKYRNWFGFARERLDMAANVVSDPLTVCWGMMPCFSQFHIRPPVHHYCHQCNVPAKSIPTLISETRRDSFLPQGDFSKLNYEIVQCVTKSL